MAACLSLLAAASVHAQDEVVDTFDTDAAGWAKWWGGAAQQYLFDDSKDADGSPTSGSLKIVVDYDLGTLGGDNQFSALRDLPNGVIDATRYLRLEFDLWVDPASPNNGADFGYLEFGARHTDYSQSYFGNLRVPVADAGKWIHVERTIPNDIAKLSDVAGVSLKMWSGGGDGFTGTATMWVDNIRFIAPVVELPPPTVDIAPAAAGLHLFTNTAGAYDRQNVRTLSQDVSWVGVATPENPVSYEFTVAEAPLAEGLQTHIFLAAGADIPNWMSAPDWNQESVVFLDLWNDGTGGGSLTFRYKVSEPNGNTQLYGAGSLGSVGSAVMAGTWTLTWTSDRDCTVTTPEGGVGTFALPEGTETAFGGPMKAYFGVQANNPANVNRLVRLSRIRITGIPSPVDDDFAMGLIDPGTWEVVASNATGLFAVGPDVHWWLKWSVPAPGWVPQHRLDLGGGFWTDFTSTSAITINGMRWFPVNEVEAALEPEQGFFRLVKW